MSSNPQRDYFLLLEKACNVDKPIFVDRNAEEWVKIQKETGIDIWSIMDEKLSVAASVTNQNIIGRYRIDNFCSVDTYELWFDLDCNRNLKDRDSINKHWGELSKSAKKLLAAINSFGVTDDYIQIKSSGRGLHFSVFCRGFRDSAQYILCMQLIQKLSGVALNVKQSETKGVTFGFDSAAISSTKRKIREFGGQNIKVLGKTHYVSLVTDLSTKKYPFIDKAKDVVYPQEVKVYQIGDVFIQKLHEVISDSETSEFVSTEKVNYALTGDTKELFKCPLIAKIASDAEQGVHITNDQRIFLSQTLCFFGDEGDKEIHRILSFDGDYNQKYTQNQISNIRKNNRKPITCAWAKKHGLCPECSGIKWKSPVHLAWKPPTLEELRPKIGNHVKVMPESLYVIDLVLATGLERCYNPEHDALWLYLIAPSGSGKTELMRLMNGWHRTYTIDELTKASLISGFKPEEGQYGILGSFNDKTVYVKDMSQTLTSNKDERNAIFGTLRNVYDGYVEKGFGNATSKVSIKSRFGLVIGMTPIIDAYYTLSNQLGERFLKVRFNTDERQVLMDIYNQNDSKYVEERKLLQQQISEYLSSLETPEYTMPSEYQELLIGLVNYTAILRTATLTNGEGDQIEFKGEKEVPTRMMLQAKKVLMLMAAVRAKSCIGKEEVDFLGQLLLQTPPLYRTQAYYHLLLNEASTINSVAETLHIRHEKAQQILEELRYLKVVYLQDDSYKLTPQFREWGTLYHKLGWYKWLENTYKGFIEYKKDAPSVKPRVENKDWLQQNL